MAFDDADRMKHIPEIHSRQFVCYLRYIGLSNISLGISINWQCPNIEVHLPFCFLKIGWAAVYRSHPVRSIGAIGSPYEGRS